ncbi:MAG: hypothetical protein H7X80_03530 [bacterium]|nr:hypothetical protein [Candidatus Kapabacteria bacterium]
MIEFLGRNNPPLDYVYLLLIYVAMYVLIRYGTRRVELNFHRSRWIVAATWGIGIFIGNYVCYILGIMSFLPWLNNAMHSFIWIGICLSFLYAGCHRLPLWEQMALYSIVSFIIKVAEALLLGTWEMQNFFGIEGPWAYIIGWSLMDSLYPIISVMILKVAGRPPSR